jgi:hypothetical protein
MNKECKGAFYRGKNSLYYDAEREELTWLDIYYNIL